MARETGLVDQWGRPIRRAELTQVHAGPTVTGVRSIMAGHPEQGLTPTRLATILREAEQGDAMRYLELAEALEERWIAYGAPLAVRKRQVSQLEITVEPASDAAEDVAAAELVEAFVEREELEDELLDILDAIGKGYSATEIIWETSEREWRPARLEWRDPRWFEFDRVDGHTLLLKGLGAPEPLAPFKFVTHFTKAKSGLPIRGGLARAAAWPYLFANFGLKDWVVFAEVYGQPVRVGKHHPTATDDEKAVLLRAVSQIGSDAAAIIPENMVIEFVEATRSGSIDLYERLLRYLDGMLARHVLGQTLTSDVGSSGSRALGDVHNEVRADIERSDARQLASTLNRDIVRPLVDLNRGPQTWYPRIRIGRPESVDVQQLTEALGTLVPLGLRVGQGEVRRKIGLADPDDEDELLTPPRPAPVRPPGELKERDEQEDETGEAPDADEGTPATAKVRERLRQQARRQKDSVDLITDKLERAAAAPIGAMVAAVRKAVEDAADFDDLQARLLRVAAEHGIDDLARVTGEAMALAELIGRSDLDDGI